jgi:hypothetical protein
VIKTKTPAAEISYLLQVFSVALRAGRFIKFGTG